MDKLFEYWNLTQEEFPFVLNLLGNLLSALLIFIVGLMIGRWVKKRVQKSKIGGSHLDSTLKPVLATSIFYVIFAMTLYAVLITVGVPPSSLIAVFGAAGLAIGLALKDTLANVASGLMLLFLRPIKVGEFADLPSAAGTITEIGLFSTTLKTPEGIYQYIPNAKVWDGRIQNFGRHQIRQFRMDIGVSYDTDLRQAQSVILDALRNAEGRILDASTTGPEALVMNFGDSSINFSCRVWLPAEDWFSRTSELRIQIFEALGKANIEIPFPQRVVTMKKDG